MSLSGEICLTCGLGPYGSRIEGRFERAGIAIEPYGGCGRHGSRTEASAKGLELPPDPTATRAARRAATPGVTGQKSADGIVAKRPP
jgi:hypothetical protein